jgi:hypothetical protein
MAGDAPVIRNSADIRKLDATFAQKGAHFAVIRGSDGYITAAAGAKVAIFSRWVIRHSGTKPDGKPMFRFKGQFRWINPTLMAMVGRGTLKGRVMIQGKFKNGTQNVDILGWDEWNLDADQTLTLENIYQTESGPFRPLDQ